MDSLRLKISEYQYQLIDIICELSLQTDNLPPCSLNQDDDTCTISALSFIYSLNLTSTYFSFLSRCSSQINEKTLSRATLWTCAIERALWGPTKSARHFSLLLVSVYESFEFVCVCVCVCERDGASRYLHFFVDIHPWYVNPKWNWHVILRKRQYLTISQVMNIKNKQTTFYLGQPNHWVGARHMTTLSRYIC